MNLLIIAEQNLGTELTKALKDAGIKALKVNADKNRINKAYKQIKNTDGIFLYLPGIDQTDYRNTAMSFGYEWSRSIPVIVVGTKQECADFMNEFDNVYHETENNMSYVYANQDVSPEIYTYEMPVNAQFLADNILVTVECSMPKKRILVIDDDNFILKKIKMELEDEYEVFTSLNGNEGILLARNINPDAILLDYQMPDMDGQIVCALIQNDDTLCSIPVFFLTSVADEDVVKNLIKMKPKGYILKNSGYNAVRNTLYKYFADNNL